MNLDEIIKLIDTVIAKELTEFEYQDDKEKIRICRAGNSSSAGSPAPYVILNALPPGGQSAAPGAAAPARAPEKTEPVSEHLMVTAPIVGTFYEAASPGAPPFVQVGDKVEAGQVLCIIEAMKLMNEIEAETAGVIVKRFVSNGQPVEYGEALFAIDPRG
jgi:acetyl-CoA carboxylase biotin carboxyl carrier protein